MLLRATYLDLDGGQDGGDEGKSMESAKRTEVDLDGDKLKENSVDEKDISS